MTAHADLPILIVGAGQGGLQLAESLRKEKYDGDIVLIGDEPHAPYHRPPLSKGLLSGDMTPEQLTIRNDAALEKKRITLKRGVRVVAIDREAHTVTLDDGTVHAYAKLALATGGRARTLPVPGADLNGVHVLRTLDDVLAIQRDLDGARRVAVVGGGFIGLEMAAVARKLGKDVVVLEAAERLMARVVAPPISDFFADLHREHGVDVRLGVRVGAIMGTDRVEAVELADGERVPADLAVLGVGIQPNTELAAAAGLDCDGGIVVDASGRTRDPDIVAVGDCTATRTDASLRRLESVQNAVEQAKAAAAALMGGDKPFTAAPWFWSDQYDVKLQMAGLSAGYDTVTVEGAIEDRSFSVHYHRSGRLIAVDSVNAPADHMKARKAVEV